MPVSAEGAGSARPAHQIRDLESTCNSKGGHLFQVVLPLSVVSHTLLAFQTRRASMSGIKHHLKEMATIIGSIRYYSSQAVFTDFVEMAAIAIRNAYDTNGRDEREARYFSLINKYKPEDRPRFAQLVHLLTVGLNEAPGDILGELYTSLDLANKKRGQYFTPPSISNLLSRLAINPEQIHSEVTQRGFITLSEPSCGSGAMVIAFASNMLELGINFQKHLHVTLADIDIRAVHMSFVQLSLLHIPATVVHGNTLTVEEFSQWHTFAHGMGLFHFKLKRGYAIDSKMGDELCRHGSQFIDENDLDISLLAHTDLAETSSCQGHAL